MDKERFDWNQLSIQLSNVVHTATEQQLWQIIHKVQKELLNRYNVDWRLYG